MRKNSKSAKKCEIAIFSVIPLFQGEQSTPDNTFQMDKKLLLIEIKSKLIKISFQPSSKL